MKNSENKRKKCFLREVFFLFIILSVSGVLSAEIVTTDILGNSKTDFPPHEDVYVKGYEFKINSVILVQVTRPDAVFKNNLVFSDASGSFVYVYDLDKIEGEYRVYATDGLNRAETFFTDAVEGCVEDGDCGEDFTGEWVYYCDVVGENADVHRQRKEVNMSCDNGTCANSTFWRDEFVEKCLGGCLDGKCIENNECETDDDCSADYYEDNYCQDSDVYRNYHNFSCIAGGCEEEITSRLIQDCGEDFTGEWVYYCDVVGENADVHRQREEIHKGCDNNACYANQSVWKDEFVERCSNDCLDGKCIENNECETDDDCGNDYYGDNYCQNSDVYRDFYNFSCIAGSCSEEVTQETIQDCGEDFTGEWVYYCDQNDLHRQREEIHKGCDNNACYTNQSWWRDEFVEKCIYGCENGKCENEGEGECQEDRDNDCVCDEQDDCPNSLPGEPVDMYGCDPFQFCRQFLCGNSCDYADFIPKYQNCQQIISFPEENFPGDCTTVIIHRGEYPEPRCTPLTCAD